MESIKEIVKIFENFIKRSLIPSSTFLLLLVLYEVFFNDGKNILLYINNCKSTTILVITLFMLFIGASIILKTIHQAIFDNFLKGDFDNILNFGSFKVENSYLKELRNEVQKVLNRENTKDYMLYQYIKADFKRRGEYEDTSRYIDDAKQIGILFSSVLIIFLFLAIYKKVDFWYIILIVPIYLLGRELIKSKYRSRAIHLYTVFLAKNNDANR